jgi:hypothetical protein
MKKLTVTTKKRKPGTPTRPIFAPQVTNERRKVLQGLENRPANPHRGLAVLPM